MPFRSGGSGVKAVRRWRFGTLDSCSSDMVAALAMHGTTAAGTGFPFLPLGAGRAGLALRCLRRVEGDALLLFCGGVEVGCFPLAAAAVEPGRTVEVPVSRLPRVGLPAELR